MSDNTIANGVNQITNIDQFVSDEALRQFDQRQSAARETADHYGLDRENSLAIGGGALALHGIDTYVHLEGEEPFDLDVLAIQAPQYRKGVRAILRKLIVPEIEIYRDKDAPLNLTVIRGTKAGEYAQILGYPDLDSLVHSRVVVGDAATPSVEKLVREKLAAGRLKDYIGLVKMQRVAHALKDPRQADPYWNRTVGEAMHRLNNSDPRNNPGWLRELVASDFDHPAYYRIPRKR